MWSLIGENLLSNKIFGMKTTRSVTNNFYSNNDALNSRPNPPALLNRNASTSAKIKNLIFLINLKIIKKKIIVIENKWKNVFREMYKTNILSKFILCKYFVTHDQSVIIFYNVKQRLEKPIFMHFCTVWEFLNHVAWKKCAYKKHSGECNTFRFHLWIGQIAIKFMTF